MLYPLSYEGVPIQYKAPRAATRPETLEAASIHVLCALSSPCVPARVHRLRTPAPGGRTAPTMYE